MEDGAADGHGDDAGRLRRRHLERASAVWRAALIDVGGANRLLFFRPTASTLTLADAAPSAVADLVAGRDVHLARLFPDPDRYAAAHRACRALAAKQKQAVEEYGVPVAHLAVGLATWDHGEQAGSRAPAAPVFLRSVVLTPRPGGTQGFTLSPVGEVQLNPVLQHVLEHRGVVLEERALPEPAGGPFLPAAALGRLERACAELPGFAVDHQVLCGAFSYVKQAMVTDVEDVDVLLPSDLVAALAGDPAAVAAVRREAGAHDEGDPDRRPLAREHLVLDADASQGDVVDAALAGRHVVVQGPPGTGKSQTIANLLACLAADGRRVLFVAQKRTAITAVLERLDGVGLGDLSLDLFEAGSSRRYVVDRLRAVMDARHGIGRPVTEPLHRALTEHRDRLVRRYDALHTVRRGAGLTLHEAIDATYALPAGAATSLRVPPEALDRWAPEDLEVHAAAVAELARGGGLRADLHTRSGWSPRHLVSPQRLREADEHLRAAREAAVAARLALGGLWPQWAPSGASPPDDVPDVGAALAQLQEAAEVADLAPGVVDLRLDDATVHRLLAATDRGYRREHRVPAGWWERRRLRRRLGTLLAPSLGEPGWWRRRESHALLLRARAVRDAWQARGAPGSPRRLTALDEAASAFEASRRAVQRLEPALQHLVLSQVPLSRLPGVLAGLATDHRRNGFPRLHELGLALDAAGCAGVVAELRAQVAAGWPAHAVAPADLAADRLRYAVLHTVVDVALSTDPSLAGVGGADLDQVTREFSAGDREHLCANAARVRRAVARRLTSVLDARPDQQEVLDRELARRRGATPVRALLTLAPDVMTAVLPVWAMSPLQVARLLPPVPCFDVVVFDEASQITPADAVPALLRARQAVVAGDSRQLPPTDFFTKVLDGAPSAELDGDEDEDAGQAATPVAESVLDAFDRMLPGRSRRLLWHYRSRDARLIATSNAYVYGDTLTTFPAADGSQCLRHEVVASSRGIRGGTNSPSAEVRRVVELVLEHARARPGESLGVITLGLAHARRVAAAVEEALAAEPDGADLAAVLDADPRAPFFVKNVERVQGDERDAVILSVGYGKGADGRLRYFWGPLLADGGQRRLNVAISRARRRMTLVTSFAAHEVDPGAHQGEGFALMHRFVSFAAVASSVGPDATRRTDMADGGLRGDVAQRLAVRGLDVVADVGSGAYRLDLAVRHPRDPARSVLAVEFEGAGHAAARTVRERDRLRREMLELRGWRYHRIRSTDWHVDPEAAADAAVRAYHAALAMGGGQESLPAPAPVPERRPGLWQLLAPRRTVARPPLRRGVPMESHHPATLVALVRHVRSDGVLRTRDEELAVLMAELGYRKRGRRIVAALTTAQRAVEADAGPMSEGLLRRT